MRHQVNQRSRGPFSLIPLQGRQIFAEQVCDTAPGNSWLVAAEGLDAVGGYGTRVGYQR